MSDSRSGLCVIVRLISGDELVGMVDETVGIELVDGVYEGPSVEVRDTMLLRSSLYGENVGMSLVNLERFSRSSVVSLRMQNVVYVSVVVPEMREYYEASARYQSMTREEFFSGIGESAKALRKIVDALEDGVLPDVDGDSSGITEVNELPSNKEARDQAVEKLLRGISFPVDKKAN